MGAVAAGGGAVTALDELARHLRDHIAVPMVHAVRTQTAGQAIAAWRELTAPEQEAVVLLLAGMCDPHEDPDDALRWLTAPVTLEHRDDWVEYPRELVPAWRATS